MKIVSTSDLATEPLVQFQKEISGEFDSILPKSRITLFSAEPPSWIELVATAAWWQQMLGAYAALYVGELIKEAAKETWKNRSKAISALVGTTNKLSRLAESIAALKTRIPSRTDVLISLPEPDEYFGVRFLLSPEDSESLPLQLALFVHHLKSVEGLLAIHKEQNAVPGSGYALSLLKNGDLRITWFDLNTSQQLEQIITLLEED